MTRNVIQWVTGQVPEARHAIVLTHNISFLFVQSVLLPRLRAAGNPRLTVFADAGCAASSWKQEGALVDGLGVRYRVVPVDLGPYRRFHPKALLLADREHAALAIGSGNLTHGGMSANREAWTFSVSAGDGAARIAAFRDYMIGLVPRLPISAALQDAVDAVFDPDHPWVPDLPPPAGLAISPGPSSVLDQLAAAAGEVRAATVLAPYYDDRGEALTAIAERIQGPVDVLLQPARAGLWSGAVASLPEAVRLRSVQDAAERPAFIHAKVFALQRENDVLLAVGSANCSRAALLSGPDAGNAELVAFEAVSHVQARTLFDDLLITDDPPVLPSAPLSDDWEDETGPPLRVLAARQEGDLIQIAFKAAAAMSDLAVVADGVWPLTEVDVDRGVAVLSVALRLRNLALRGKTADGQIALSSEVWVDDEASLSAPATLRRVFRRFADLDNPDIDPGRAYQAVLEVFPDYLLDPEATRRIIRKSGDDPSGPPAPYDPAAVFSDDFGRSAPPASRGGQHGSDLTQNVLALLEALFTVSRDVGGATPKPPEHEDEEETQDLDDPRPAAPRVDTGVRDAAALRRVLVKIEAALARPEFTTARSAALLGADLSLTALLLVMGLAQGHLQDQDFRDTTRRLWEGLFFGRSGAGGSIPQRINSLQEGAERDSFIAAFATPRLAAALSLWCVTEWWADDADAMWFRLSAIELQGRLPWLFAAAAPEDLRAELDAVAAALLPSSDREFAARTWEEVVRGGAALQALMEATKGDVPPEAGSEGRRQVEPGVLVRANRTVGFPTTQVDRGSNPKVRVRLLGRSDDTLFVARFVKPIENLLDAQALNLPEGAESAVRHLVETLSKADHAGILGR